MGRAVHPLLSRKTPVPHGIEIELIDRIKPMVRDLVTDRAATLADLRYAGVRLEVSEGRYATAENGASGLGRRLRRSASGAAESDDRARLFGRPGRRRSLPLPSRSCAMARSRGSARQGQRRAEGARPAKYPGLGRRRGHAARLVPAARGRARRLRTSTPGVPLDHMVRFTQGVWRAWARSTRPFATTMSTSTALCRELFACRRER
jgi:hypothetical protein